MAAPVSALVVDPRASDRISVASALGAAGFHVTVADTFASAKERMSARPPTVLIADVCLAEYNGIHLVIRGMAHDQKLASVVTCDHEDIVLRDAAEKLGATFLIKPVSDKDLVAAVLRTLFRKDGESAPIRPPFNRRNEDRRARPTPGPIVERRIYDRRQGLEQLQLPAIN